jgi:hypothetical protein
MNRTRGIRDFVDQVFWLGSRWSESAKAAEGRRTPKPSSSSLAFEPREASWSAVPPHRFGIGLDYRESALGCRRGRTTVARACEISPDRIAEEWSFGRDWIRMTA